MNVFVPPVAILMALAIGYWLWPQEAKPVVPAEPAATFNERFDAIYDTPWVHPGRDVRRIPLPGKDESRLTEPPPINAPPTINSGVLQDDEGQRAIDRALLDQAERHLYEPKVHRVRTMSNTTVCAKHGLQQVWVTPKRWRCLRRDV